MLFFKSDKKLSSGSLLAVTLVLSLGSLGSLAHGQNSHGRSSIKKSLSELEALEARQGHQRGRVKRGHRVHSPSNSNVNNVFLNHTPNQIQGQEQEQGQWSEVRQGWGNGASLEHLRRHRKQKEAQTEQFLMEKIEDSRLREEERRREKIERALDKVREYNKRHKEDSLTYEEDYEKEHNSIVLADPHHHVQPHASKTQAPPLYVVNNQASHPQHPVVESSHKKIGLFQSDSEGWYIRGQLGTGSYDASNAQSTSSWGLAVGRHVNPKMVFEFNLLSSQYTVDDPRGNFEIDYYGDIIVEPSDLRELNQRNYSGILGYNLISAPTFRGTLRAGLSYVQRKSSSANIEDFSTVRSDAIDWLVGGLVDFELSHNFYVVGSFDYFQNLTNEIFENTGNDLKRVEVTDYYVIGVGLKLEF